VQWANNLEERTHPEQVARTSDVFPARSAVLALAGSPQETPCDCRHKSLQLNTRCTTHHVPKISKVKLKEENKWTQTLQHAKLAGKMKRHQVTATGSN